MRLHLTEILEAVAEVLAVVFSRKAKKVDEICPNSDQYHKNLELKKMNVIY